MFTIDTNSWHYRTMERVGSIKSYNHPRTVCQYFRRLFFCLLFIAIMGTLSLTAGALVCFSFYQVISWLVISITTGSMDHKLSPASIPALAIMTVVVLWYGWMLIVRMYYRYTDWASARSHAKGRVRKEPKPNLLVEWIKNRHDKVCTRVEYK